MSEHELPNFHWLNNHFHADGYYEDYDHSASVGIIHSCDETLGESIDEWYPEFEVGYYIVDFSLHEVLDFTKDEQLAQAYQRGYEKGRYREASTGWPIPQKHTPTLGEIQ